MHALRSQQHDIDILGLFMNESNKKKILKPVIGNPVYSYKKLYATMYKLRVVCGNMVSCAFLGVIV